MSNAHSTRHRRFRVCGSRSLIADVTGSMVEEREDKKLKAEIVELRAAAREHAQEKRALATENLAPLHRARIAEQRVGMTDRGSNMLPRRDNQAAPLA